MSKRRTFSKETKLSILKEAKDSGVNVTLLKHGLYSNLLFLEKEV